MNGSASGSAVRWQHADTAVKCAAMTFITGAVVIGNLVSVLVRLTHRRLRRQVSTHFIQSLAAADLCVGLLYALPGLLHALPLIPGPPGAAWVTITVFLGVTATNASMYSVLSISVDRYIAVMMPLRYRAIVRTRSCQVVIVCTWVWSGALAIPVLTPWVPTAYSSSSLTATIIHRENFIYMAVLAVVVHAPTLLGVTFIYPRVMCVARKHVRRERLVRRRSSLAVRRVRPESVSRRTKYLRSTVLVAATYHATCLPRAVYLVYELAAGPVPWLEFATLWVYITTSFLNCVLYSWGSGRFRGAAAELWRLACGRDTRPSLYRRDGASGQLKPRTPVFRVSLTSRRADSEASIEDPVPFNKQAEEFYRSIKVPGGTLEDALRRQSWTGWTNTAKRQTNRCSTQIKEEEYCTHL